MADLRSVIIDPRTRRPPVSSEVREIELRRIYFNHLTEKQRIRLVGWLDEKMEWGDLARPFQQSIDRAIYRRSVRGGIMIERIERKIEVIGR